MNIKDMLENWLLNPGASELIIENTVSTFGFSLPSDYIKFISQFNGGEGFIGDSYLILWKIEELKTFNQEYEVEKYAPGLFLFGSDGGGEGYGFDTRDNLMRVIKVPFIGMDLKYSEGIANNFTGLLEKLKYDKK